MRVALFLLLAACEGDTDPRWQLAHDRIVAIRTTPAAIGPGQTARIDGLVASVSAAPAVIDPIAVTGPGVAQTGDGWTITAPADGSTVDILATFEADGVQLTGTKSVRLDGALDNPAVGAVTLDGAPVPATIAPLVQHDLAIDEPDDVTVRWLTSCGSLNSDDTEHDAELTVEADDATTGSLVVVVRDDSFGVAWQIWPLSAR
ncbi:MAG TPA: hypothetical protein VGM88_17765 [Kofleriaceae bacterium]